MPSKRLMVLLILSGSAVACAAQASFKLVGSAEFNRAAPGTVNVEYSGPAPAAGSSYLVAASWKVYWNSKAGERIHSASVSGIDVDTTFQTLLLHLTGDLPPYDPATTWKVVFVPSEATTEMPQIISGTQAAHAPGTPIPGTPNDTAAQKKSCSNTEASQQPFFCPPPAGKTPDIILAGSFLAGGGTKPIYAMQVKGTLSSPRTILGFHPSIATDIEINESKKPPVNTSTFNPDSITAGVAFNRVIPVQKGILYGMILQAGTPSFEFSASDPSSSVLFNPSVSLVLNSWQPSKSVFATLYPYFALETGENMSKPSVVEKVPVNFSDYNAIVREVLGADAVYAVESSDRKGTTFSITGAYRARIPEYAEPQIRTFHEKTTVTLGTNTRHWFEGDLNFSPWSFKYLAINGKYQYGELPPLFKLVDHSFTIGFTLQANQTRK
jgi:hypothetical protein